MILEKLQEKFGSEILKTHQEKENLTILIRKDQAHEILKFLKEDASLSFEMLVDLCGVDFLKMDEKPRFEVVYHLYSLTHNHRLRLRVKVPEEDTKLKTATDLWHSADWAERETREMFGIDFEGHANPKKLLLFEGFEGHPLRKDYPMAKRQKIPVPQSEI